jgi:polyphosphate kinase
LTDRVSVRVLVDRFLEHSRVFYFAIDGREDVFITSTDVVHRSLDGRIELMVPIEDERLKRRIVDEVLGLELADDTKAAAMGPDGTYRRVEPRGGEALRAQATFIALARRRTALRPRRRKDGSRDRPRRKRPRSP